MMLSRNAGLWLMVVAVLSVCLPPAMGQGRPVRVELRDGRQISGELVGETGETVTITISGIETTFPREQVASVTTEQTLEQRYQQRRADVADDDWAGRYAVARWLYDQGETEGYELAIEELESLLEDRPEHQQAELLHNVVTTRLERQREAAADESADPDMLLDDAPTADLPMDELEADDDEPTVLSEQDIALMKAFEVNLYNRPTVVVPRQVVDDIFERYREDPALEPFLDRNGKARFLRLSGYEQLAIIFDMRAREYYDQVVIRTEPATLRQFRTRYHLNYVVRYCGQCHGQGPTQEPAPAPGLTLLTQDPSKEATAYTNLLILRRTEAEGLPLIYKNEPFRSPLVQYALPRAEARTPHPEVRGWRPHFNSVRDRRLEEMLEWIDRLYGNGRDYPIEFDLPGQDAREEPREPLRENENAAEDEA